MGVKSTIRFLYTAVLLSLSVVLYTQSVGYVMPKNYNRIEIPFSYQNEFIVMDIVLNGALPMKFIYDTGAETTILTNPRIAELLDLRYTRKFEVMGSDLQSTLTAYLIKGVSIIFEFGFAPTQDVLVFDKDYFNLEEFIGKNVQGIIGNDVFRNYIVTIDYRQEKLVLNRKGTYTPPKSYTSHRIQVEKNKPYIRGKLSVGPRESRDVRLLMDTGASLSLLLDADKEKNLDLPDKVLKGRIGYGISGEIEGYIGRINEFGFGKYQFPNLITNFRVYDTDSLVVKNVDVNNLDTKDGIIGNEILSNFRCVFDFPGKRLYVRPYVKNYYKKIKFDRSGMTLIMVGEDFESIMINNVFENSPAEDAGLQKGDILRTINGFPVSLMTYGSVVNKFKRKGNKSYKVRVNRQGEIIIAEIQLRDLI
ncbi:MAG: aspartyl protease family protein [Bacteroidia bacterium]|nr:aspartyl protease family protein [Bacteroidia bacterium]